MKAWINIFHCESYPNADDNRERHPNQRRITICKRRRRRRDDGFIQQSYLRGRIA
jgi:hypothetical protein